ncbi:MAG: BrnT family toxin [Gammaproteobacteria bacterium]|nr:BrnT family toxin [Gammaproteobacteria bacterium]
MTSSHFDWDEDKDRVNQEKHRVPFQLAQRAFSDPQRVIAKDVEHSQSEDRFYCFGMVYGGVLTVRFTYRDQIIRIFGAGYWRKGKAVYEIENQIHR